MAETWTAPSVERTYPDRVADERTSLEQWVDFHRATLLHKCAGLTAEQLKQRAVGPSRLSLLGLVRHMTEVEMWWFRMHAAGEDLRFPHDPDSVGLDFENIDTAEFTPVYHYQDQALFNVELIPVGHTQKRPELLFFIGMKRAGGSKTGKWLIDYWQPRWRPPVPAAPG